MSNAERAKALNAFMDDAGGVGAVLEILRIESAFDIDLTGALP